MRRRGPFFWKIEKIMSLWLCWPIYLPFGHIFTQEVTCSTPEKCSSGWNFIYHSSWCDPLYQTWYLFIRYFWKLATSEINTRLAPWLALIHWFSIYCCFVWHLKRPRCWMRIKRRRIIKRISTLPSSLRGQKVASLSTENRIIVIN